MPLAGSGLTPGAVALRIKMVEAELGATLIGRAGRRIAPTATAARLLAPLRALVAGTADLKRLAANEQDVAGELRLGTIPNRQRRGLVRLLLRRLAEVHPHLDVFIEPGTSLELCERVLDGVLDAAIVVEPPATLRKAERFTPWVIEPLVLIAPPGTSPHSDPLVLLQTEVFIRYDRRTWGGRLVDAYLRRSGIVPRDRFELDGLDGIVALVSAGLGVAIIPDWVGPHPQDTSVARLPLPAAYPYPYRRSLQPQRVGATGSDCARDGYLSGLHDPLRGRGHHFLSRREYHCPATQRKMHVPAAQGQAIHVQRAAALRDMLAIG